MRNFLNTPRKAVRMLTARLPFTSTLSCDAIAPFLMPFSENALDAKTHARIAEHIATCPGCQTEVQMLGEMGDFFRANPPQTAVPAPNLWQSIEAQIQAETPERIATFNARPPVTNAPPRGHFDWNSFVRGFAATGGVMTAVVACVWILAAQHPLEQPLPAGTHSVATLPEAELATTIQLIPKRSMSESRKTAAPVVTRIGRMPALRLKSLEPMAHRGSNLRLLGARRVADASLKPEIIASLASGALGQVVSQSPHAPQAFYENVTRTNSSLADRDHPLVNYSARLTSPKATEIDRTTGVNTAQDTQEVAQTNPDSGGGDTLPAVRKMVDSALEQATVVAVAASLSAQKQQENAPALAALPDVTVREDRSAFVEDAFVGNASVGDASVASPRSLGGRRTGTMEAPVSMGHRALHKTQVAWLVEDGARSERSAADATRTERRQQSLFSYGSR